MLSNIFYWVSIILYGVIIIAGFVIYWMILLGKLKPNNKKFNKIAWPTIIGSIIFIISLILMCVFKEIGI